MVINVTVENLTKNAKNGTVGKISKKAGDRVRPGEKILQIESVKGNTAVNSKVNGVITEILVSEGAKVKLGDLLLKIEKDS